MLRAAAADLLLLLKWRIYCHRNPRTCRKRRLRGGGAWARRSVGSPLCQVRQRGEGRVKPPQSLNTGVFNVRGCCPNEIKKGEIAKMFLRRRFDVCALRETKLKGKGGVMLGEVMGRVSGLAGGRAREGVSLLLSGWLMRCVIEWKEVSSWLMWVRVKKERELGVYIGIWTG